MAGSRGPSPAGIICSSFLESSHAVGHSSSGSVLKFPDHADADDVMGVKLFSGDVRAAVLRAPSLTSVFPRFSYPDVNFWIWIFGKRYREVVRGWEVSVKTRGAGDRR